MALNWQIDAADRPGITGTGTNADYNALARMAPHLTQIHVSPELAHRAALTVAAHARDVADCADLLDALGLLEVSP